MQLQPYFYLCLFFAFGLLGCQEQQRARVIIEAPIEVVWAYTADSTKAKDWSVFFDHIEPVGPITDGQVGAFRRCFRRFNKTGLTWDEEIVQVVPYKFRQLRTFNIQNSPIESMQEFEFDVFHHLRKIDEKTTELVFSSRLKKHSIKPHTLWQNLEAGLKASHIIQLNLENIKTLIENRHLSTDQVEPSLHPFWEQKDRSFDR